MTLQTAPSLDDPKEITIFGMQTGLERIDLIVGLGIPVSIFVTGLLTTTPLYITLPVTALSAVISLSIMYVTPGYMNVTQYLKSVKYYLKRTGEVDNTVTATVPDDQSGYLSNIKLDESTQDMVMAEKFYTEANLIERSDGTFAGALRIKPPNRDFDGDDILRRIGRIRTLTLDFNSTSPLAHSLLGTLFHNWSLALTTKIFKIGPS